MGDFHLPPPLTFGLYLLKNQKAILVSSAYAQKLSTQKQEVS
ncbi:unnamed protein product [Paramecium octaurelia]|uniref:Uncharacterized protein n=1 Tax=Paramecium octaurelia TaxID=43137 RepID=A0A8S1VNA6_PAROT|nr:unnamed protein product [Paramecium octaurelia]